MDTTTFFMCKHLLALDPVARPSFAGRPHSVAAALRQRPSVRAQPKPSVRVVLSNGSGPSTSTSTESRHESLYSSHEARTTSFGFARDFHERFEVRERVGAGTFAVVYRCVDRATGTVYAVKSMPKRRGSDGTLDRVYVRRVRNEVDICSHLGRSLNVCYLYCAYEDEAGVDLVMEMCSGGQLWDRWASSFHFCVVDCPMDWLVIPKAFCVRTLPPFQDQTGQLLGACRCPPHP
jgi:hypothetical protein